MNYTFLLGREPLLSSLELNTVLAKAHMTFLSPEVIACDSDTELTNAFRRLGGSIKLGKIIQEVEAKNFFSNPLHFLSDTHFLSEAMGEETSIAFALNIYGDAPPGFVRSVKPMALQWKKFLRGKYDHVRYVESKERTTSSVTVKRNKLLRGCDMWIICAGEKVTLAKTISVQDYQDFSERDFGRPMRNARNGMLPPKLARMMVNMSGVGASDVLLDPFVGSGTVLQEAALLGVAQLIGTDIQERVVADTKQNLDWLQEKYHLSFSADIRTQDIHDMLGAELNAVTHIVTELDLGQPLTSHADPAAAQRYARDAGNLAQVLFDKIANTPHLKSVVIALPFWPHGDGDDVTLTPCTLPTSLHIRPVSKTLIDRYPKRCSSRNGILYSREDQFVGREILIGDTNK